MRNKKHVMHRKNNIFEVSVTDEIKSMLNNIIEIYDGKIKEINKENKIKIEELNNKKEETKKKMEKYKEDKTKKIQKKFNG